MITCTIERSRNAYLADLTEMFISIMKNTTRIMEVVEEKFMLSVPTEERRHKKDNSQIS